MTTVLIVLLSLTVGVLVGLLGIGGGVVLVPALVYLLHYDQHLAQGTSLLILLPPIGLGALREYWKNGQVDLRAGIYCALGFLIGGYGGGKIAVPMPSNVLRMIFGCFLMMSAVLLWRKTKAVNLPDPVDAGSPKENALRALGIFCTAGFCGVAAGMVGIGGGVLLVPLLSLLFGFSLGVFFAGLVVAYAGGAILYNTSNIMHQYRPDQHVAAALALFASVALMFWYVLRIVMSLASDD